MLCEFIRPQFRIAMEGNGVTAPLDLDAYRAGGGFEALRAVREGGNPEAVVATVLQSGLRGRGGAGFPTGRKWRAVRDAKGSPKTLICNGDEGDPGAFMDRMLLESFPFRVLEGMLIAAYAMGIEEGILYIRAEYPHAVASIRKAIQILEDAELLGPVNLKVVRGAGAFVCGEETALISSLEGHRGTPRVRPPFPAESGLWGKPTCVNNVETFALLPWLLRNGSDAFAAIGSKTSKGTKVFALAGAVRRGGLIEVPMGTTIRQIVEEIGGGVGEGRTFKAVLVGGPSGGCVPASLSETPVDYEALQSVGAIMGSGGMVVLDDHSCMVDVARFFIRFTQSESCGKCTMCRVGTRRMMEILDRICEGNGVEGDLETLETLASAVTQGSLCGLGQTAPNPVLSTLRHFRSEYEAHLQGRCPAGRCVKLIRYRVNDRCIGCTRCAQVCPVDAIPMRPHQLHVIDNEKCVQCDMCRQDCPEEAIVVE
jgi:NADH-quinone oxidoreductase subunit F